MWLEPGRALWAAPQAQEGLARRWDHGQEFGVYSKCQEKPHCVQLDVWMGDVREGSRKSHWWWLHPQPTPVKLKRTLGICIEKSWIGKKDERKLIEVLLV